MNDRGQLPEPRGLGGRSQPRPEPALCARCHDTTKDASHPPIKSQIGNPPSPMRLAGSSAQHPAIKSSGCTVCHDPHASTNPSLLKLSPAVSLCYRCHAKDDDAAFIHTAVRRGDCLGCHNPHAGEAAPLLLTSREAICFRCHQASALSTRKFAHPPVLEGRCLECHDPHRADLKDQLNEKGKKLCLGCHDASAKAKPGSPAPAFLVDLGKKHLHRPVASGDCQQCHTQAHRGDFPHLLDASVADTCFKCHARFDPTYNVQHAPVADGDCGACHDPHSADSAALLKDANVNQLCIACHAAQTDATHAGAQLSAAALAAHPGSTRATLECTSCHLAHGSSLPHLLRAERELPAREETRGEAPTGSRRGGAR